MRLGPVKRFPRLLVRQAEAGLRLRSAIQSARRCRETLRQVVAVPDREFPRGPPGRQEPREAPRGSLFESHGSPPPAGEAGGGGRQSWACWRGIVARKGAPLAKYAKPTGAWCLECASDEGEAHPEPVVFGARCCAGIELVRKWAAWIVSHIH